MCCLRLPASPAPCPPPQTKKELELEELRAKHLFKARKLPGFYRQQSAAPEGSEQEGPEEAPRTASSELEAGAEEWGVVDLASPHPETSIASPAELSDAGSAQPAPAPAEAAPKAPAEPAPADPAGPAASASATTAAEAQSVEGGLPRSDCASARGADSVQTPSPGSRALSVSLMRSLKSLLLLVPLPLVPQTLARWRSRWPPPSPLSPRRPRRPACAACCQPCAACPPRRALG